jgi:hypothetical protein
MSSTNTTMMSSGSTCLARCVSLSQHSTISSLGCRLSGCLALKILEVSKSCVSLVLCDHSLMFWRNTKMKNVELVMIIMKVFDVICSFIKDLSH